MFYKNNLITFFFNFKIYFNFNLNYKLMENNENNIM